MAFISRVKLCPAGLGNNPNKNMCSIEYITIHTTGNYEKTATASRHADYLYNGSGGREASWHYTVDDKEVWQSFGDIQACWHTGDSGGKGNNTSIGIEICVNDKENFPKACENAAILTASLLKKHGLSIDKVVQHNHWSGKNCPKELRSGEWGINWTEFIEMTSYKLNKDYEPDAWAKNAWEWAVKNGVTDGSDPRGPATREQVVQLIFNAYRLK